LITLATAIILGTIFFQVYLGFALLHLGHFHTPVIDLFLRKIKIQSIPLRFISHFVLMNLALLAGFFNYLEELKTMSGNQQEEIRIKLNSIEEALEDIKNGKTIIVVDDEDRENEGDFICAAELVTPETVNFMATHGKDLICAALTEERCAELEPSHDGHLKTQATTTLLLQFRWT
jgi:hypothetical protein